MMEPGMTCGRLGGDEFAVVLPNVQDAKEAEDLAHRIIATLSRPYVVDNHQLFVGASVGYAMGPQDGATVETLTRNADLALYRSKDKGGNVVAPYVPSLQDRKSDVSGKRVSVRVDLGGRGISKKKTKTKGQMTAN